ncbi:uncharacterized protein LOC135055374 isoform X2 [Pseudophryne corroboree]|uniref:uncharacterized protein LOC135055374 isoform X2 n=1 Tax=Pseudophryne corroboree TaxID=495146 RepID=UPI0030816823
MEMMCSWILNKIIFLKHKLVGLPDTEPALPPPWSLESPFQNWTVYSKASLAASMVFFAIFIILHLCKRPTVPTKTMARRASSPLMKGPVLFEQPLLFAWSYSFALLLILCLFVSIPWEWVRLYQIEVAKKASVLSEGYSRSCYQADLSFWETLKVWLSWNFSWERDSCESYYKALMVDPFWEVTPLMSIYANEFVELKAYKRYLGFCSIMPWLVTTLL